MSMFLFKPLCDCELYVLMSMFYGILVKAHLGLHIHNILSLIFALPKGKCICSPNLVMQTSKVKHYEHAILNELLQVYHKAFVRAKNIKWLWKVNVELTIA